MTTPLAAAFGAAYLLGVLTGLAAWLAWVVWTLRDKPAKEAGDE